MHTIVRVALRRLKGQTFEGRILETFESLNDPELEREIVTEIHSIPVEFPQRALKDAEEARQLRPGKRIDLTHSTIVTIDGETARDFDDAIGLHKTPEGNYSLTVSIADVAHYVRAETSLNHEALSRATSVYFPDHCIPMLPETLSNDLCSLVPHQERMTLTCEILLSKKGEIIRSKIYPSKIKSAARLTYTLVSKVIEKGQRDLVPPKIAEMLEHAFELAQMLRKQRFGRGALDLDLPEAELKVDEFGDVYAIQNAERNEAHKLIEDFMILANEEVSSAIEKRGYPSIYRVHETPDPLKLDRLQKVARHWGIKFDEQMPPQKYLESVRGHANEKILVTSLLRSMKQAVYSPSNVGHYGLGSESYTHFTSPIRRFPDLIVHRILRRSDFLKNDKPPYEVDKLDEWSRVCSEHERRAFLAEREMEDFKKSRFMAPRVGQDFAAVVVSVKNFGLFVELEKFPIQGLLPLRHLPMDDYWADELELSLSGHRGKHRFFLGDRLMVKLTDVDRFRRQITFKYISRKP